jgi:uncharacterized protein YjiS (DUF1127 family)
MSVTNLLTAARRAFSERRRRERAYAELTALDDHSLADIGLRRSQIIGLYEGVRMPEPPAPPIPFPKRGKFAHRSAA